MMIEINDDNWKDVQQESQELYRTGLTLRDFKKYPVGTFGTPFDKEVKVIPREEWPERIAQMNEEKSRLSDIYDIGNFGQRIPSLDQNGQGFCWAYSTVGVVQCLRAKANMPYVNLSPHAVACKIFGFQDRGAWGALSAEWISKNGVPSAEFWPQKSMNRRHDTPDTWENAKLHRITEGWIDLDAPHPADAKLSFDQIMTLLLMRIPVVTDFDWWGHSVFALDPIDFQPSAPLNSIERWGYLIQNSWGDGWSENGRGRIRGRKAFAYGGCAPRFTLAA